MRILNVLVLAAFAMITGLSLTGLTTEKQLPHQQQSVDSLTADRAKYLKVLRERIKGRERLPSDSVFKNIQTMKGVPAGRLLAIMDIGFSQSLGVSCGHCHNTSQWDSEEKPQKQIARDMGAMVGKTRELLKEIKGLKSENPSVNCTTCHRGAIKPALDLGGR